MAARDDLPEPAAAEADKLEKVAKLNYRSWLWLQFHKQTEFAGLARLVLGGGPENVWANKPLRAAAVEYDIAQMYATGRGGITLEIYDQAKAATEAYRDDDRSVHNLIQEQKKVDAAAKKQLNSAAQTAGMSAIDAVNAAHPDEPPIVPVNDGRGTMMPYSHAWSGEAAILRVECDYQKSKNVKCSRVAVPGATRCDIHGGQYLSADEIKDILQSGQERLVEASTAALNTVIDIMQNSVRDEVRLKAAEMVLDRAGFRAGMDINVRSDEQIAKSPIELMNEKLNRLAPSPVVDQDGNEVA